MPDTIQEPQSFTAFLADRSISADAYSRMPGEMQEYLRETWQIENHIPSEPTSERAAAAEEEVSEKSAWTDLTINRAVMWVGAACLALVLLAIILPVLMRPASSASNPPPAGPIAAPGITTSSSSTAAAPAVVAPAPSAVPAPETGWSQVARAGGSGTQRTSLFQISGPKWRITWMTRPSSGKASEDLHVNVYRGDGSPAGPAALVRGESEGEAILRGRGPFQIEVSSGQSYLIRVFDYR